MNFEGKLVLVTGASRGIGKAIAAAFAAHGAKVVGTATSQKGADAISEYLGENGCGRVLDVADQASVDALFASIKETFGADVDVLVNNAGMFFMQYLDGENLGRAGTMLALHVTAATELSVLFGERMKQQGGGYILIMSSMTARIPAPGIAVYSAST